MPRGPASSWGGGGGGTSPCPRRAHDRPRRGIGTSPERRESHWSAGGSSPFHCRVRAPALTRRGPIPSSPDDTSPGGEPASGRRGAGVRAAGSRRPGGGEPASGRRGAGIRAAGSRHPGGEPASNLDTRPGIPGTSQLAERHRRGWATRLVPAGHMGGHPEGIDQAPASPSGPRPPTHLAWVLVGVALQRMPDIT